MIDSISDRSGVVDLKKARRQKSASSNSLTLDRLPPHSLEAEQGIIGCELLAPNECIGEIIEKLKDSSEEAFYDLRHQVIQKTLTEMYNAREPIDLITFQQKLKDKQLLEQIGGISYLNALQDAVPSAANLSYYLEIVQKKFVLRKLIHAYTEIVGKVYEHEGEVDRLMDEVETDILKINESRVQGGMVPVKELVHKAIDTVE